MIRKTLKNPPLIVLLSAIVILASSYTLICPSCGAGDYPATVFPDKDYAAEWKTADSLIGAGLPQSALKIVTMIYSEAKNEGNSPQLIKAILYRIKLGSEYQENFLTGAIKDLHAEAGKAEPPTKQVLHSILADLYWRFYTANRYKFYERAALLPGETGDDPETWDLKTLVTHVTRHYLLSLGDQEMLKATDLKLYDVILETEMNSKKYRPTLFDFLAHRAADFFINEEPAIIYPAERFAIDREDYFSTTGMFSALRLTCNDSLSNRFQALKILQKLAAFHEKDRDPAALIDVELKRLDFIRNNYTGAGKDSLYMNALTRLEKAHISNSSCTMVSYAIASELNRLGNLYNPHDEATSVYRFKKREALEKCDEAIRLFPGSEGAYNCSAAKELWLRPTLNLKMQDANPPGHPFLASVAYQNLEKLYFRIIVMDYDRYYELTQDYRSSEDFLDMTKEIGSFQEGMLELPETNDFQPHSTEMEMPALDPGFYILVTSASGDFDHRKGITAFSPVWITGISYIDRKDNEQGYHCYFLDRESGEPLPGATVKISYRQFDYTERKQKLVPGETLSADEQGYLYIPALQGNEIKPGSFNLDINYRGDRLVTDDYFYRSAYYKPDTRKEPKTWFFTDRAIYRPGQTVYFKGIVLEKQGNRHEIKHGYTTEVIFTDANNREISRTTLTTSEFGSFSGSFTAPQGTLTGMMNIKNENGYLSIRVEEYKRPSFEATINQPEDSYKLGEKVELEGSAKSFAGFGIDGARVTFRVVRETRFPWYYRGWYDFYQPGQKTEITNGETATDENGSFALNFTALPDYSVPALYRPYFNFHIIAEVTDINGETQSSEAYVNVGYEALLLDTDIESVVEVNDFRSFSVSATNLNGKKVEARGTVKISLLKEPDRIFRNRMWEQPDVFVIPKDEYRKEFPHDMYRNEGIVENLQPENLAFTTVFNTGTDSVFFLRNLDPVPGRYSVEIVSEDEFGEQVKAVKFFTLYSKEGKVSPMYGSFWSHIAKTEAHPGDTVQLVVATAENNLGFVYETTKEGNILHKEVITLQNGQRLLEIPVDESMRGGFTVHLIGVKNNRAFNNSYDVAVPFSNKDISFVFSTFRDKLTPGQKEEWSITLHGEKGEALAAEMLTAMYDASLDVFVENNWNFSLHRQLFGSTWWEASGAFGTGQGYLPYYDTKILKTIEYDRLNWFGFNYFGGFGYRDLLLEKEVPEALPGMVNLDNDKTISRLDEIVESKPEVPLEPAGEKKRTGEIQVRRDFRETAFFFPALKTDGQGRTVISFTMPESLTRWKLMGLAHTKDLKYGQFMKEVVTKKDLMVIPNPPRFFREGDEMEFSAKVVNLSEKSLPGEVTLEFFDLRTGEPLNIFGSSTGATQNFEAAKGESHACKWKIIIPSGIDAIKYRIKASSYNFSDGEEKAIPVLKNRMLVTETMPMPLKGGESRTFVFDRLKNSAGSTSLESHKLTLEFSSNPAWYAIQALPYLMEGKYESADYLFNRYYANSIAQYIINSSPRIKEVFDAWKEFTPDALLSQLEKNQELKSLMLEETPWIKEAQNETEQKQRIALLFDMNRMSEELSALLLKLRNTQKPGGGWPWFEGMPESRNITQNIVAGFGKLSHLGVVSIKDDPETFSMVKRAIGFLDLQVREDYRRMLEIRDFKPEEDHLGEIQIQYLYARNFFLDEVPVAANCKEAYGFFRGQATKYWTGRNSYLQSMIALSLHRGGDETTPAKIIASLKEHALYSDEMGMYWRSEPGYFWYEAPVETQAMLIAAFEEVTGDNSSVEKMKIWLLKQKQTQNWKSNRATAEAVYALLLRGEDWLQHGKLADITVAGEKVDPFKMEETKVEAGTGYFTTSWSGREITPAMAEVTVENKNKTIAWGAVYWQYFESLDRITAAASPLNLTKSLFVERNTKSGPVIEKLSEVNKLMTGEKVVVRIELRVDRDMEYVHLKDMRAAAFEPVNVLLGYRYRSGLGYYESTRDASANFFFDYLPKGTYVFEYPLVASQAGNFSNGVTSVQCLYAPEFSSHSEGVRVEIGE